VLEDVRADDRIEAVVGVMVSVMSIFSIASGSLRSALRYPGPQAAANTFSTDRSGATWRTRFSRPSKKSVRVRRNTNRRRWRSSDPQAGHWASARGLMP